MPVRCRRACGAAEGEMDQNNAAEFQLQQKIVQFRGNRRRGHPTDGNANPQHLFKSTALMFIMRHREGRRRSPDDDAAGGERETSSGRRPPSLRGKRTRPAGGKRTAE